MGAGRLRIFSTETDEQVGDDIDVGSGLNELEVNRRSTRAYVLGSGGRAITVVDLTAGVVVATIDTPTTVSIGLVEQDNRLVALQDAGLQSYDLGTNEAGDLIPPGFPITNGIIDPIPGTSRGLRSEPWISPEEYVTGIQPGRAYGEPSGLDRNGQYPSDGVRWT